MTTRLTKTVAQVTTLEGLLKAIRHEERVRRDAEEDVSLEDDKLMANLPTFGGVEPPGGTHRVFSWDAKRLLVVGYDGFCIVRREEWAVKP